MKKSSLWLFIIVSMLMLLWALPAKAQRYSSRSVNTSVQYRQAPPSVVGPLQAVNGPLPLARGLVPVSASVNTSFHESGNSWGRGGGGWYGGGFGGWGKRQHAIDHRVHDTVYVIGTALVDVGIYTIGQSVRQALAPRCTVYETPGHWEFRAVWRWLTPEYAVADTQKFWVQPQLVQVCN